MARPQYNSRKGLMVRCQNLAHYLFQDWRPYNPRWRPSVRDREKALRGIADLREALDAWEASL